MIPARAAVFALAAAAWLLGAGPARASEGEIKPVLDFQAWDLGLWTAITFAVVLAVLYVFAWEPILDGLRKREGSIRDDIDQARKDREEAERLREELKAELQKANDTATAILAEARQDAENFRAAERQRVKEELDHERDRLKRDIAAARDQALQEIYAQAVELATLMSAKAIGREITTEDHQRLFDESLADLKQNMTTA